ncbi:MAG: CsgG/HfaB family protein, partial [Alphaproteobacteria bacterium]
MRHVRNFKKVGVFLALLVATSLSGCETIAKRQLSESLLPPVLNPVTKVNHTLRTLPPPTGRVVVAVYGYTDQTGQMKPTDGTQTLSKAVTQGATSVLVKALQDTGNGAWFTVVERERLDHLLKERRIVQEMRKVYLGEQTLNPKALPALLFAGILLEGGIIGYDSNLQTGGIGARLLGIGADVKYRLDTVTVYLRAVSTKTGQVLASVTTHKSIASIGIQGGVFRYIAVDKILESEAGITKNEPKQFAVQA